MRNLRNIHLYLGCFFAPLLVFFCLSGAWQVFDLHEEHAESGYEPPAVVKSLSGIHKHQRLKYQGESLRPSVSLKWLSFLMALGVAVSSFLGVLMALKTTPKKWLVWLILLLGFFVPIFYLYLG